MQSRVAPTNVGTSIHHQMNSITNRSVKRNVAAFTAVNDTTITSTPEIKLVGPNPQKFAVADGETSNIASAAFGSVIRLGAGVFCLGYKSKIVKENPENKDTYTVASLPGGFRVQETSRVASFPRPPSSTGDLWNASPLTLYDTQDGSSRKIREAICILDLDVLFKPCPEGGPTWNAELTSLAAPNTGVPTLVDNHHGVTLSDADEIVAYLFRNYGNNRPPFILQKNIINDVTAKLAMLPRKGKGSTYNTNGNGTLPQQPIEFWGYEPSPFTAVVREVLCELEIPHLFKSVARGSPKRQELFARRGHFQAPYIEDPNTGVAMFESKAIIEYLKKTYGGSMS